MATPLLSFAAEDVRSDTTEYTRECVVYLIAFGTGNPEAGGHCWNFSRSFDDDWGVCTVREIQRATIYEGIVSFEMHRSGIECVFDSKVAEEVGFSELRITFEISDGTWQMLAATARVIFRDRPYFALTD
jgi:hypothetical protein